MKSESTMKQILVTLLALAAVGAWAEPSGDRPDATHAWAVHDVNRPDPVKITVPAGGIPSDAIILFDGTPGSISNNWCSKDGSASKWIVKDGEFVCTPGSGSAVTREKFADCQLHIEWKTPLNDVEGWGNSGVILMGAYEIQILDSSAIVPSNSPWKPANYADGQAGAVYGQNPALVNPCRKPGEWQSFDVVFHPPRYEGKQLVDPGDITVFFNGVLVQDCWKFQGGTGWCRRASKHPTESVGPLTLQDHGHPVPFRNIWIRKIPSRYDNCVSGGPYVKPGEVQKLRHELAVRTLALAGQADDPAEKFIRLWETYCYEPNPAVRPQIAAATTALIAALKAKDKRVVEMRRAFAMKRFVAMLVKGGFLESGTELEKTLNAVCAELRKPKASHLRDI